MADIDTRIKEAVEQAITAKQNETLEASKIIAETIATKFLERQEKSLTKYTEKLDEIEDKQLKATTLKKPGNQNQFSFCEQIEKKLKQVENSFERVTEQKELEDARKYLEEGKKLVLKRKKLIKLADREDWSVVTEYMSDNMASNSEDEKRINRARKTANAKSEKARKIKTARRERYQKLSRPGEERSRVRTNEFRSCWNCGRVGHVISQCHSKDYNRGNLNRSQFHSRDSFFKDK